jgi:hypothetical protein
MGINIFDLIDEMADSEEAFYGSTFVCPIFNTTKLAAQINGVNHFFDIPEVAPGWYKVKAIDTRRAEVVSECDFNEQEQYSKLFPKVRMTLVQKEGLLFQAIPSQNSAVNLERDSLYPVFFADDFVQDFDQVVCRTDGSNIWFEESDMGSNPEISEYLRTSLEERVSPSNIAIKGLTPDDRKAYALRVAMDEAIRREVEERARIEREREIQRLEEERQRAQEEERRERIRVEQDRLRAIEGTLEGDVAHAGGEYIAHEEKSDHYRVRYLVEGVEYISYISKNPGHQVLSAGICLDDTDDQFDLKSLVTVIREGQDRGLIHRTL